MKVKVLGAKVLHAKVLGAEVLGAEVLGAKVLGADVSDVKVAGEAASPVTLAPAPGAGAPVIEVTHLDKTFLSVRQERVQALTDISLSVGEREFVTIVGPSGCGKSTLLKILAGLVSASAGSVRVAGSPVAAPRQDIGIVFQNPILLPWRTVIDNVLLPAEVQRLPRAAALARARELIAMVGLAEFESKYPMELSGGMQQRAAISRALLHDPRILLMDEPFGALDALTREQMNLDLQRIWLESRKTVVLITHSIPEAVFLGDRVVVLTARPGRIARILPVPFPRPRGIDVMGEPLFGRLSGEIRRLLFGQDSAWSGEVDAGSPARPCATQDAWSGEVDAGSPTRPCASEDSWSGEVDAGSPARRTTGDLS
jgi:NitT/TauT family transport system ATP-binding protein